LNNILRDYIELPVTFFGFITGEDLSNGKMSNRMTNVVYKHMQINFEKDPDLLKSCAENIVKILHYLFNKEKYDGYHDLPRIALRLVYLGTLAKKYNFNELTDEIILKLYEFEYRYGEKYFANLSEDLQESLTHERERLSLEISHWRDVVRGWRQHDRMFYEEDGTTYGVNMEDVDNFIFYAWGYFFHDSHIAEDIERKRLIKHFVITLNKTINDTGTS
jgi:hypothetical protein